MSANMLREQKYECENMPKHPRSVRDAQYAKLKRSTKISGAPAPGRPMDPDPSDGSVDVSPAHSPCTEQPRKSRFPFFPSRAAPVDCVSSPPRAPLERGFFRAARRSKIVATIDPQCLTYCNKSSFPQRIIPMHIAHPQSLQTIRRICSSRLMEEVLRAADY
jgi:hypothetical protein